MDSPVKALVPPGWVVYISEPEYIGTLPIQQHIHVGTIDEIQPRIGTSLGEREFQEHGSIALRIPTSTFNEADNTIDGTWTLAVKGTVLVRAKRGGFYWTSLEKRRDTWFVRCGRSKLDVTFCDVRKLWVVRKLP